MRQAGFDRCGFSLVEMLVVISVVGILMAMMVPVISRAKEKARSAKCMGNLKELHTAAMNYAFQSDDGYLANRTLPSSRSREWYDPVFKTWHWRVGWVDWTGHPTHSASPGFTRWWGVSAFQSITSTNKGEDSSRGTLWEHTGKSMRAYVCPTFCRREIAGTAGAAPDGMKLSFSLNATSGVLRSYAMNAACSEQQVGGGSANSRRILFADMSESIQPVATGPRIAQNAFNDGQQTDANMWGWNWDGELSGNSVGTYPRESIGTYHDGKGNAIFVDGHVERLSWTDTTNACAGAQ